jgi:hypothetical protein
MNSTHLAIQLEINRINTIGKLLRSQLNYKILNDTYDRKVRSHLSISKYIKIKAFGFIHLFFSIFVNIGWILN